MRTHDSRTPARNLQSFNQTLPPKCGYHTGLLMSDEVSTEVKIALLVQGQALLQKEIEENKREAEADVRRVKDEADAEIERVREKADADAKANAGKIAALEAERTKALKWGVMTLGSAVMGMAYWIFDKLVRGEIR